MATPPSDDSRELFKLLIDGDWHDYQTIKKEVANKVPPGRALRKYQERLRQNRELRQSTATEILRSEDEQIQLGALACAQIAMTSWKGKGLIVKGEGLDKQVKIKPGFRTWGIEVESPTPEAQDSGKEPGGYTEVPPSNSEPFEAGRADAQALSGPTPPAEVAADAVETPSVPEPAKPVEEDVLAPIEPSGGSAPASSVAEPAAAQAERLPQTPVPPPDSASHWVTNLWVWECPECFIAVTDVEGHRKWHEQTKALADNPDLALVDKVTFTTLLRDVMGQALAEFQEGMEDYLAGRFAELERQIRRRDNPRSDRVPWMQRQDL